MGLPPHAVLARHLAEVESSRGYCSDARTTYLTYRIKKDACQTLASHGWRG